MNENENSGKSVWCSDAYSSHIKSECFDGKCIINLYGQNYELEIYGWDNEIRFKHAKLLPLCKKCFNRAIVHLIIDRSIEPSVFLCQEHYMQLKETIDSNTI